MEKKKKKKKKLIASLSDWQRYATREIELLRSRSLLRGGGVPYLAHGRSNTDLRSNRCHARKQKLQEINEWTQKNFLSKQRNGETVPEF